MSDTGHLSTSLLLGLVVALALSWSGPFPLPAHGSTVMVRPTAQTAEANFTTALNRLVDLVGASGGALLALVWARVALSWFSNDITKKVQAKDRARDALIGSLLFTAALTGLAWGLAHWVLTGT
ncbi:MAG: hypothetical protein WCA77_08895 [Thermoplasmata archaeon]